MSMTVYLYKTFTKIPNSTEVPAISDLYDTYTGEIKGDFVPYAPVITFAGIAATSTPTYVYARVPAFNRYYFVRWAFVSGMWQASCVCDVMGSYREDILSSTQFVTRSKSNQNQYLIDSAYTPTGNVSTTLAAVSQSDIWGANYANGTYVIGVVTAPKIGDSQKSVGAVMYYAMDQIAFSGLMYALLSSPNWMQIDVSEISEELQKALINPAQYIVSAVWLPIDSSSFIGSVQDFPNDVVQSIKFGWWEFNLQRDVRILHEPTGQYDSYSKWLKIKYTEHPQTATYGMWVNLSPYAKHTLDFPPFGCIDLDTTDVYNAEDTISCHVFVHAYNGEAVCYVFAGDAVPVPPSPPPDKPLIATLRANVGVQIPVGQIVMDISRYQNAAALGAAVGAEELVNIVTGGE